MRQYIYKCKYCRASLAGSLFLLPLKTIQHEWLVHQKLFTDSWNPVKVVRRLDRTVKERKNAEFLSGLTKGKTGVQKPPGDRT
jgi:hypothetical protein